MMLGLGALCLPAAAQAQDTGDVGPYGSLKLGGEAVSDFDFTVFAPAGTFFLGEGTGNCGEGGQCDAAVAIPAGSDTISGSIETDIGFAVAGALGYDFGMFRIEAEAAYGEAGLSGVAITGASAGGNAVEFDDLDADIDDFLFDDGFDEVNLRQLSAMANAWFDIPLGQGFEPYIGGGVGITDVSLTGLGGDSDSETLFTWQLGAGVAIPLSEKLKLTLDYRHRETERPDFGSTTTEGIASDRIKTDAGFAGLRFYF